MGDGLPYLTSSDEAVRAGGWTCDLGKGRTSLPEWLPHWDASQQLCVRRELEIDLGQAREEAGVAGARLAISATFQSSYDDLFRVIELPQSDDTTALELEVELDGAVLGNSVTLTTSLVLAERLEPEFADVPLAHRRGSVLWRDARKCRLRGDLSQFPMSRARFADLGYPEGAPWYVEIDGDLEAPAMGAIQLFVNDAFPRAVEAAHDFSPDRKDLAAVRSMMLADAGRILVEYALSVDELDSDWPEDSLGAVLLNILRSRVRGTRTEINARRTADPHGWAADMAATFALLRDV